METYMNILVWIGGLGVFWDGFPFPHKNQLRLPPSYQAAQGSKPILESSGVWVA